MKRTTLALDEAILRSLKRRAAEEGRSMQEIANQLLRRALSTERPLPFKLKLSGWKAELQPGVDILDRDKLFDLLGEK